MMLTNFVSSASGKRQYFVSSRGMRYRFAFQVRPQPDHYDIGQEAVVAVDKVIDDNVANSSIYQAAVSRGTQARDTRVYRV